MSTDDAQLVARVLQGDRDAFAAVYERYGDRLYDFAYSMLRSTADAQDAVADSFVLFAERLGQLRDPSRLRPWLYAIVRSECLRRFRGRDKIAFGGDDAMTDLADDAAPPPEVAETEELRRLVWEAAAGLAERDRMLLDLNLRQGLDGADLAEAMGVSTDNAYVMLSRVKGQMERSLGALLVARTGRSECGALDGVLGDWDGGFTPLIRKRVARHVDSCVGCTARKGALVSPAALFAGVAAFAAPSGLRERVLDNFANPPAGSGSGPWRAVRHGVLAAVLVLVIAGAALSAMSGRVGHDLVRPAVEASPTPTPRAKAEPTAPATTTPPPSPTATTLPAPFDRPPVIGAITTTGTSCTISVTTTASDDHGVATVVLSWSGPTSGSESMSKAGSAWTATMPVPVGGQYALLVKAADSAGKTATRTTTAVFDPCPQ